MDEYVWYEHVATNGSVWRKYAWIDNQDRRCWSWVPVSDLNSGLLAIQGYPEFVAWYKYPKNQ